MEQQDIRWKQRFFNFDKSLKLLAQFMEKDELSEFEELGLIHTFEMTYELAWNLMKDFYQDQGEIGLQGSKDSIRIAYSRGLITSEKLWLEMVQSRTLTSHTYDEETADEISEEIKVHYYDLFRQLHSSLFDRYNNQTNIFDKI